MDNLDSVTLTMRSNTMHTQPQVHNVRPLPKQLSYSLSTEWRPSTDYLTIQARSLIIRDCLVEFYRSPTACKQHQLRLHDTTSLLVTSEVLRR